MTNTILRLSALGAAALTSLFLFLPACHPIGACDNCNPAKEYCFQYCEVSAGLQPATCEPIPDNCLPTPTCACLVPTTSGPGQCQVNQPGCDSVQCSGDAKNGFFVEDQAQDAGQCA